MNREDIYNGITDIRDDQVEEAGAVSPSKEKNPSEGNHLSAKNIRSDGNLHSRGKRSFGENSLAGKQKGNRKRFSGRKWWHIPAAAVLIAAVLIGFLWEPWSNPLRAYAISTAEYPKQAKYSLLNGDPWRDGRRERFQYGDIYAGTLENYTTTILPGLLTGAGSENRVCSPINVYMGLSMLAELTEGESRSQILKLLDCDTIDTLRTRASALWNANYVEDGTVTSIPANSLWLNEDLDFNRQTLDLLSETYYASSYRGKMGAKGFDRALQEWVNQNTNGRLKNQSSGLTMAPDTVLDLVSTFYYRAKWSQKFSKDSTAPGQFHAPNGDITADFMHETIESTYYWGEKFAAAAKYLKNSGYMWFLLPDESVSMDELLTDSSTMEFLGTVTGFLSTEESWEDSKYMKINLSLPKFDVVSDLDLVDSLKALGITDVFDPYEADFTPMLGDASQYRLPLPPYVSSVKHAARVTIDEEGCEATSYLEMMGAGAAAPPDDEVDFILDRPFLFAITGEDGALLFAGIVNQP